MAKTGKTNISDYSFEKKSCSKGGKGGNSETPYSSSKGLAKTGGRGQGVAPEYAVKKK